MDFAEIREQILIAAQKNQFDQLKKLVAKVPVKAKFDDLGNTLFLFLVSNEIEDIASWYLMNYNPDTSMKNNEGKTALHIATEKSLHGLITCLIQKQCSEELDNEGRTSLIIAVINGDEAAAKILLLNNRNAETCDKYGLNALSYAMLLQNKNMFDTILKHTQPKQLSFLLTGIPSDIIFIPLPIEFPYKTTILHIAVLTGDIDMLITAIKISSNISACDSNGLTALDIAAKLKLDDFCYILSSLGVHVPLFDAIEKDDFQKFSAFIDLYGNCIDTDGSTPLHYAVKYDRIEMIRIIAARFPSIPNFEGISPYSLASDEAKEVLDKTVNDYTLFGINDFQVNMKIKHLRFAMTLNILLQQLDTIIMILNTFNLQSIHQNTAAAVGIMLIESHPKITKIIEILRYEMNLQGLERFIEGIIHSQAFDSLISSITEMSSSKPREGENISIYVVISLIFWWIRIIFILFNDGKDVYNLPTTPLTATLYHILQMQTVIDDYLNAVFARERPGIPQFKKIYSILSVHVSDAKLVQTGNLGDHLIKEKIHELFSVDSDNTLMLPPYFSSIADGVYTLIITEGKLLFVSLTSFFVIPIFGLYIITQKNPNNLILSCHAGSLTLHFEEKTRAKFVCRIINTLTKKYSIPEIFLLKDGSKKVPIWLVFSYMYKRSITPSITIKAAIIKNSSDVISEAEKFYNTLSSVKRDTLRCHPFSFPSEYCSTSVLEN